MDPRAHGVVEHQLDAERGHATVLLLQKKKPSLVSPPFSHCQSLHYLISHFLMRMHRCAVLLLGAGTLQSMCTELKRSLLPAGWCREVWVMLTSFISIILQAPCPQCRVVSLGIQPHPEPCTDVVAQPD